MTRLAFVLDDLLRHAEQHPGKATRPATLERGLKLSMKLLETGPVLCLFRDEATAPSREEAITCAHALGWLVPQVAEGQTAAGLACLFVAPEEAAVPAQAGERPELPETLPVDWEGPFAAILCQHLPKAPGQKWHTPLTLLTDEAARILGRRLLHWRDLTRADAQVVVDAIRREYPHGRAA